MSAVYGRVYVIRNTLSNKLYVGKTVRTIAQRFKEHVACHGKCRAIESAIQKYGANVFDIKELAVARSQQELNELEILWIAMLDSIAPKGYNLSGGGEGAGVVHKSTKALLSKLAKSPERLVAFMALRARPDVIAKQNEELRARWANPEFKKKVSASIKAALNTPDTKARHIAALDKARNKPEYKANLSAAMVEVRSRPEVNEKRAASVSKLWKDCAVRNQRSAAIRAAKSTPEFKARYAATNARPEVKARRSAANTGRVVSAETRLKKSLAAIGKKRGPYKNCKPRPAMAAKWADPAWREKILAARKDAARKPQSERNER